MRHASAFAEPEVKRCPECKSEDIDDNYKGHYLRCRTCGYVDFFTGRWVKRKEEP